MKLLIISSLLVLSLCTLVDRVSISKKHIEALKGVASFEIYDYEDHPFKDFTPYELQMKLGLRGLPSHLITSLPRGKLADVPENFLAKDKWPTCVHEIRDQQRCGSCWAFAATEVLSDRFCIASEGAVNVILSPQDMVSCDKADMGCNGA